MPKLKYKTFSTYEFTSKDYKSNNFSKEDIIDRTGYISEEDQYARMMLAGVQHTRAIDDRYGVTWNEIKDLYSSNTLDVSAMSKVSRFNDAITLDGMLKEKLKKYHQAVEDNKKIKSAYDRYLSELEAEKMKKDIINNYLAEQAKKE